MGMTRGQIKQEVQGQFGEAIGTDGAGNPFLLDRNVTRAGDEVARATSCYTATAQQDTVANQPDYDAPSIYQLYGAYVFDASGNRQQLREASVQQMDAWNPGWRDSTAGTPLFYIPRGDNRISLWPTPSASSLVNSYTDLVSVTAYTVSSVARPFVSGDLNSTLNFNTAVDSGWRNGPNKIISVSAGIATLNDPVGTASLTGGIAVLSTGGVWIEGLGVPGSTWSNNSDLCPLPERAHDCVMWRACILRCRQFPRLYNDFLPGFKEEYERTKGMLERETSRLSEATRGGVLLTPDNYGYGF